jgi:hypothetical protein
MAAPAYFTDLNDINLAEADTWVEMSTHKAGADPILETDYYIHGDGCCSQSTGGATGTAAGMAYDYGSNIPANPGDCFFIWQIFLAGNDIYSFADGGMRFYIGSGDGDWDGYKTAGDDFGRNPYGGWFNAAVDPRYPYDYQEGTPAGTYRWFASLPNLRAAISKGNPHAVDALRYGRGAIIATNGDATYGYATFVGMAEANDAQDHRWGLFQDQPGGYLWKGLMLLGTTYSGVDFRDSNRNIIIEDTPRTYVDFNKIVITNDSSNVEWTGINITALNADQLSPGNLVVSGTATFTASTCTFTDMTTFEFNSNTTLNNTTFRRCDQMIQSSAIINSCNMEQPPVASGVAFVISDNPEYISSTSFTSGGQGHAIEITNSGTYGFSANTFTGYSTITGSLDTAVYNSSGGHVVLNITNLGDTPAYRNSIGSTTQVNNAVDLSLLILDENQATVSGAWCYIEDSAEIQLMNEQSLSDGTAYESYNYLGPESAQVRVRKYGYKAYRANQTIGSAGLNLTITLVVDPQQI